MECDSVVEAAAGELGDSLDMVGGKVRPQPDDDIAAGREGQGQAVGVGHHMLHCRELKAAI